MLLVTSVILSMQSLSSTQDPQYVVNVYRQSLEKEITRDSIKHMVHILHVKYKKANLPFIVNTYCWHLSNGQQKALIFLPLKFQACFDGIWQNWDAKPVKYHLKPGVSLYCGKAFPVPQLHGATLWEEGEILARLGALEVKIDSELAASTFYHTLKEWYH